MKDYKVFDRGEYTPLSTVLDRDEKELEDNGFDLDETLNSIDNLFNSICKVSESNEDYSAYFKPFANRNVFDEKMVLGLLMDNNLKYIPCLFVPFKDRKGNDRFLFVTNTYPNYYVVDLVAVDDFNIDDALEGYNSYYDDNDLYNAVGDTLNEPLSEIFDVINDNNYM